MGRSRSRSRSPRRDRDRTVRRSRSRSRERERRRERPIDRSDRHRERDRDRERERPAQPRDRRRSRSPSPGRWPRGRSVSPPPSSKGHSSREQVERPEIDESQLAGKTDEEIEMMKHMGFCGFETTKGKAVVRESQSKPAHSPKSESQPFAEDSTRHEMVVEVETEGPTKGEKSPDCAEEALQELSSMKAQSLSSSTESESKKSKKSKKEKKKKREKRGESERKERKLKNEGKEKKEKKKKKKAKRVRERPSASDSSVNLDPIVDLRKMYEDVDEKSNMKEKQAVDTSIESKEAPVASKEEPIRPYTQSVVGRTSEDNDKPKSKAQGPFDMSLHEIPLPPSPVKQPKELVTSLPSTGAVDALAPSPKATMKPCQLFLPRSVSLVPPGPDCAQRPEYQNVEYQTSSITPQYYPEIEPGPRTTHSVVPYNAPYNGTPVAPSSDYPNPYYQSESRFSSFTGMSYSQGEGSPHTPLNWHDRSQDRTHTPEGLDSADRPFHRRRKSRFSSSSPARFTEQQNSPKTPLSSHELSFNVPITPLGVSRPSYCLRCFTEGHQVRACRNPKRCRVCRVLGHYAGSRKCEYYTEDPNIIGFQGAKCILSNFYPCTIKVWGMVFHSTEQAYQWKKAMVWSLIDVANQIMAAPTARDVKFLCKHALRGPPGDHTDLKLSIMKEVLRAKADSVPEYAELLMRATPLTVFGEGTTDMYWATGLNLQETQKTRADRWPGKNVLGTLHRELADALQQEAANAQIAVPREETLVSLPASVASTDTRPRSDSSPDSESENRSDDSSKKVRKDRKATRGAHKKRKHKSKRVKSRSSSPSLREQPREKQPKKRKRMSSESTSGSDTADSKRKAPKDNRNKRKRKGEIELGNGNTLIQNRRLEQTDSQTESVTDA